MKPVYWNLGFNFICGFVYMSPEGSSILSEENMFYVIEHELANMKIKYPHHKFLIGRDFNAYTKQEPDFIQFDSMSYINDDIEYAEDNKI